MKNIAFVTGVITVSFLIFTIAFCQFETSFKIMNILFIIGNFLIVLMVYRVLKSMTSTSKTFADWYEDQPKISEKN
ncbi:hypothetical protein [Flavobacterium sp. RSSB_23]|uniref:hypothetical protein n=1 Tax=Flavobacterium sp. RSSB_23 TaxID=3447668 RepID=UPI003F2CC020